MEAIKNSNVIELCILNKMSSSLGVVQGAVDELADDQNGWRFKILDDAVWAMAWATGILLCSDRGIRTEPQS